MSLKYTLNAQINIPIPSVKSANRIKAGKINNVSNPILAPKKNIKMPNGIKENNTLINEVRTSAIGNAIVSTFIDFKMPRLLITEIIVVFEALLKKFQKIKPVSAYKG